MFMNINSNQNTNFPIKNPRDTTPAKVLYSVGVKALVHFVRRSLASS